MFHRRANTSPSLLPHHTRTLARSQVAVPALMFVLKALGGAKKKKKKKALAAAAAAAAGGEAPKPKKADPISQLWKEVWPTWGALDSHMLMLMFGNAVRVYISHLIANNVRVGDGLLISRNTTAYRAYVFYSIRLSLSNNLLDNTVNYVRDQLARKWRAKLTKTMQDEYFASSNFYHAEQHMKDSDVRMTEDVKALAEGFTEFFTAGTYTATTGVFYTIKVWCEFEFSLKMMDSVLQMMDF